MKKFLVTLSPLKPYFFAGERGFENNQNYFIHSMKYPHFTTILGMIRKQLLIENNLLKSDFRYSEEEKNEMSKLIGKNPFNIKKVDIGKIRKVSTVFILDTSDNSIIIPNVMELVDGIETQSSIFTSRPIMPNKKYDSKEMYGFEKLVRLDNKGNTTGVNGEVFISLTRAANRAGASQEGDQGFFKQEYYTLKSDYVFALELELDDAVEFSSGMKTVQMGGERSLFKMTISKQQQFSNTNRISTFYREKLSGKELFILDRPLLCLSGRQEYHFTAFGELTDFRYMNVRTNDGKLNSRKNQNKYQIYSQGTILVFNSEEDKLKFHREIEKAKLYEKIGIYCI